MEVNIFLSFVFGMLSFFSPCVLPLVPGYLTIFSGAENTIQNRFRGSLEFCLGFSIRTKYLSSWVFLVIDQKLYF